MFSSCILMSFISGCNVIIPQNETPKPDPGQITTIALLKETEVINTRTPASIQIKTSPPETSTPLATMLKFTQVPTQTASKILNPTQPSRYLMLYCIRDGCIYNSQQTFLRPIPDGYNRQVESTYRYGSTQQGNRELHYGIEFVNPTGTPVIAAASGKVIIAGDDKEYAIGSYKNFYGNLILLEHNLAGNINPVYTLYGHLSQINVNIGDQIERGQIIGLVGRSGTAIGSHLHFEIRQAVNDLKHVVNPELWLEPNINPSTLLPFGTAIIKLSYQEETIYSVEINIQNFSDPNATYRSSIYTETYTYGTPKDDFWQENLVVGDIPPGIYRASFTRFGKSYQKYFEIESDRITLVEFEVDN